MLFAVMIEQKDRWLECCLLWALSRRTVSFECCLLWTLNRRTVSFECCLLWALSRRTVSLIVVCYGD